MEDLSYYRITHNYRLITNLPRRQAFDIWTFPQYGGKQRGYQQSPEEQVRRIAKRYGVHNVVWWDYAEDINGKPIPNMTSVWVKQEAYWRKKFKEEKAAKQK
jgi:hypothetical protein